MAARKFSDYVISCEHEEYIIVWVSNFFESLIISRLTKEKRKKNEKEKTCLINTYIFM